MTIDTEQPKIDDCVIEPQGRLIGDSDGVEIALPVIHNVVGECCSWRVQRTVLRDLTRDALADNIGIHIESRLEVRRELITEVGTATLRVAPAMIAVTIGALR